MYSFHAHFALSNCASVYLSLFAAIVNTNYCKGQIWCYCYFCNLQLIGGIPLMVCMYIDNHLSQNRWFCSFCEHGRRCQLSSYLLTYKNLQVLSVIQKLLDSWYLITSQRIKLYKFGLKHFPFCISQYSGWIPSFTGN